MNFVFRALVGLDLLFVMHNLDRTQFGCLRGRIDRKKRPSNINTAKAATLEIKFTA